MQGGDGDFKPKKGWGVSDLAQTDSRVSFVMQAILTLIRKGKAKKKNLWEIEAEEVEIAEAENEDYEEEILKSVAAPPAVTAHKVIKITDLNNDIAKSVPSSVEPGIDLSVLTQLIRPVEDLIEADMSWDYKTLQTEISQAVRTRQWQFREKFGDKSEDADSMKDRRQTMTLARLPTVSEALT